HAHADAALPIGADQTISQPYMVARICAELQLRGGEKVLDVGTGSGYQAAVLAELGADVYSLERIPALAGGARAALEAAGYSGRVRVDVADGTLGLPAEAPFEGLAVPASRRTRLSRAWRGRPRRGSRRPRSSSSWHAAAGS